MPRILIVGAGQDGLFLAHRLLSAGFDITMITSQTSIEARKGRSSVVAPNCPRMWEMERRVHIPNRPDSSARVGLDLWLNQAPTFEGVNLSLRGPGQPALDFAGRFPAPATVIERRVKMADWLEFFEDRGGKVAIQGLTTTDVDYFARSTSMYDLVVLAVGRGELGGLFDHDPTRSSGAHSRVMTQAILYDVRGNDTPNGDVISTPEGEVFVLPVLTAQGPATAVFATAMPGKGLDCQIEGRPTASAILSALMGALQREAPDVFDRCVGAQLVDEHAAIQQHVRPVVRQPVGYMASGGHVLGMADTLVTTDPVSGQGAANSTIYADIFADAIIERGDGPFDEEWMRRTDAHAWQVQGRHTGVFSDMVNGFWTSQPEPYFRELLMGAAQYQEVRDRWVSGFDDPSDYARWMFSEDTARAYLAEVAARN